MHERFEKRIEEGLLKIAAVATNVGRNRAPWTDASDCPERNTRAARLFDVHVELNDQGSHNYAGRQWKVGESGRAEVKAATCCAAT